MKDETQSKLKKYRADIILIAVVLSLSLLILLTVLLNRDEGSRAIVEVDGAVVGSYSLSVDGVVPLNGGTNVLVIEGGAAYLTESHCPDHTCEKTGKVRYVGQTIVCLPNHLTVTVKGDSDSGVDLVS